MTKKCTKQSTQFGTPLCCCPACDESRRATMRRVFVHGVEEGPDLDWDYELADSYTNAEHGA